ncbi:MAG: alpha-hydroxy-acid oxidizing protein, partial [Microcoleus sp. SIO2G3]|nr:alpha-hydroxy-acid oxidizing protein [Microcoleus sp. SIO2G3]
STVLGQTLSMPILIAPMAFQCLAHPNGEVATARAATGLGTSMVVSTLATKSLEDVADTSNQWRQENQEVTEQQEDLAANKFWFQLYVHRDRGLTQALVERAQTAGYQAICLTVDSPVMGHREKDKRNQFTLPTGMSLANLTTLKELKIPERFGESGLFAYFAEQINPALTWADLDWLCSLSPLPVVVKGILRGDDALKAVEHGANAVIVSNHGGRQLDGAIASMDALSEVVAAVSEQAEVLVDGGIRRGTDVLKALALGAKAVLLGRPVLWGLAVGGEAGVRHVLQLLRDELDIAMALSGCACVDDIDSSLVLPQTMGW